MKKKKVVNNKRREGTPKARNAKNTKTIKKRFIVIALIIILAIIATVVYKINSNNNLDLTPEILRSMSYDVVEDGDEAIDGVEYVEFDAFFLKDLDSDGIADSIRGTCNEVGSSGTLYMELNVIEEGYVTDGKITINAQNFYFKTAIVADDQVAANYISSNTTFISFNDIENGTQKLLYGSVRSGNYDSSTTMTSAIGTNTNNYSRDDNYIEFSGTYVDADGNETEFSKKVYFTVDWYGEVNASITAGKVNGSSSYSYSYSSLDSLISDDTLTLEFTVYVKESLNELIMYGSYIYGTIPEFNGFSATSCSISGTNVTYTFDEESGDFTAQVEASLNSNGKTATNGYTSTYNSSIRYTSYKFTVQFPAEAYTSLGDTNSMQYSITINAYNKGYNNPNTEDGFENPYVSDIAKTTLTFKFSKYTGTVAGLYVYVGTYKSSPYYDYIVSKQKPLNIYNGISETESDDTYIVTWRATAGSDGESDGWILEETNEDKFKDSSSSYTSMEDCTTNIGIYFSGASSTLGDDGWIEVYDADTDILLETFTSDNWGSYSKSSPYYYDGSVAHIRVETSAVNASSILYVYSVKELDDEYITENYTKDEFDELTNIYSYLTGKLLTKTSTGDSTSLLWSSTAYNDAQYVAPTSIATISITEDVISTQVTAENEKITIKTDTSSANTMGWVDGMFLVKLPEDILFAEINSVTVNNSNVTISAYSLYEEDDNWYIKILTENTDEETYTISIDCDLTPGPRIASTTEKIELYAINGAGSEYYYSAKDIYDVDGDSNVTEYVNYRTDTLELVPGSTLTTVQMASGYDDEDGVTIAPRVAEVDKQGRSATITVSLTNNYSYNITDVSILGVIPFEGNTSPLTGKDLGSDFTTYITSSGISIPDGMEDYITVYYSTNETATNDLDDESNGWITADEVEDWNEIKCYLIVIDSSYSLEVGETIEFSYTISIPEGIDYNEVSYTGYAVYFALETDEGLYYTQTSSQKLGFMVAKQYDLSIVKYQEDTEKVIQGVTFTLTEDGEDSSSIATTDENGTITFSGLYAERYYTLKEQSTTDDYVLNEEEIRFYTYTVINDDDSESLYLVYVDDDGNYQELTDVYSWIRTTDVYNASSDSDSDDDYTITISLDNEVKAKLKINKTTTDGDALKNVKFTLSGEGIDATTYITTDKNGEIDVSGLYLGYEYTLTEIKATGYYVAQSSITFTIENVDGEFVVTYSDANGVTSSYKITTDDEIPTLVLNLTNEKIPTYSIQITKYEADSDTVLENAQFRIYGEGISDSRKVYTTDENGVLTIDGLYEYVEGKYITGEYTITEIYAPEGYALDSTTLKFRAYRDDSGNLQIEILVGESVIRVVTSDDGTESQDLSITDGGVDNTTIYIGVENNEIFKLYKYYTDDDGNEIGLEGVQFIITDLSGNYVTGSDGEIIGELTTVTIDGVEQEAYVVTTDENGLITANLSEGLYKAVEVATGEAYQLDTSENYFGIGTSQAATFDWVATVQGSGWDYVTDVETVSSGVVGVGSISLYNEEGADLNQDNENEQTSSGSDDGLIVKYSSNGTYEWSSLFGGTEEDELTGITATSDGGYAIVGSTDSQAVYYNGSYVEELSSSLNSETLGNKDVVLIKISSTGSYEWGVRFGGTLDDEAVAVIETSDENIALVGRYYSSTFNFLNTGSETVQASLTKGSSTVTIMNGFVASYTSSGTYSWSQNINGSYDSEVVDIAETSQGIAIGVNHISTVYLNTSKSTSQAGASTSYVNGTVVGYDLDGTYSWRYRFYPSSASYNVEIGSISVGANDEIFVGVNHAYKLYGGRNGSTGTTITSASTSYYAASIIELTNTGVYSQTLYTLDGTYDDFVSGVVGTSDGGVLFGGWYYSTSDVDADGDGETGGTYDLTAINGTYTSDAYVIKIDGDGTLEYLSQIYGDGYDTVQTVAQTTNGAYIAGGSFTSTTLSATNFDTGESEDDEETSEVIIENLAGNTDAFIIAESETGAEIPELQTISVENVLKEFTITTEVIAHEEDGEEVDGGTITGNTGTYNGTTYTEGDILYIETVEYGKDGTINIVMTPDDNYIVSEITVNGEEYTTYTINSDGTVTISAFTDVTEDIHVTVEYSNTIGNVTVNHYLWTEEDGTTTTKVADSKTLTGDVGDTYTTEPETDLTDYEIITNADYYGDDLPDGVDGDDYYIPDNATGTYSEDTTYIVNYYYKEKSYTLTVYHYLAGTDTAVPLKGTTTGETVPEEVTEGLEKNSEYTTSQADEDTIDYNIYELVETPENAEGTITENTVVIYYYQEIEVSIEITKVSQTDSTVTLSGAEFSLFRLICEDTEHEHDTDDDLIDVEGYDETCWELVGTYTTDENGILSLEDLEITGIYRLVETATSDNSYLLPSGQWKIEFDYGQFEEEEVVDYNGTGIKITAIGNPPAFSLQTVSEDDEETDILYLYNEQSYDIPTTGGLENNNIYLIGILMLLLGISVITIRKHIQKSHIDKYSSLKKSVNDARKIVDNLDKKK